LDLENTWVVEIQKGILLYSCHIVRKFLNIDTNTKKSKCGSETPVVMFISTALLLDSIIRNSVCTPAKLPCRRVVEENKIKLRILLIKVYRNHFVTIRKNLVENIHNTK
jgi:hypothetical protein